MNRISSIKVYRNLSDTEPYCDQRFQTEIYKKECSAKKHIDRNNKKLIWSEASYTVEATLIMCFIICVILGIVFIGFYVHDGYITEIAITECVKKENRFVVECSDRLDGRIDWEEWSQKSILWRLFYQGETELLKQQVETKIKGKLLISSLKQMYAEVKVGKVQLQYEMNIHLPGKWIQTILGRRSWFVQNQIEIEEKESEELIRLCRGIKKQ